MSSNIWYEENVTDEQWEEYAQECDAAARAFEQRKMDNWAEDFNDFYSGHVAIFNSRKANLARAKGIDSTLALQRLDGTPVDSKIVEGKYGDVWRVKDADGIVRDWVNVSVAKSPERVIKFYESKGYKLVWEYYHFAEGNGSFYPLKNRGLLKVVDWSE